MLVRTYLISLQANLIGLVPRYAHCHELGTEVSCSAELARAWKLVLEVSGHDALLCTHDVCILCTYSRSMRSASHDGHMTMSCDLKAYHIPFVGNLAISL